ncbi:YkvA family protein [Syntrophomonas erecta]
MKEQAEMAAESGLKEAMLFLPNLMKLVYRLMKNEGIAQSDKVLLVATAAYVLSPWDLMPDMIPFLGQVDDLLLLALVLKRLMDSVSQEVLESYWDGNDNLLILLDKILNTALFFIPPGIYRKLVKKARTTAI